MASNVPAIEPSVAAGFTRLTAIAILTFAAIYGMVTIIGGAGRWSTPAYDVAMQVPGAPQSWGVVLLGSALMGLLGFAVRLLPIIWIGFAGCTVWSGCFAWCVGVVAARNPQVGWGGVIIWLFLAALFAACTAAGAGRFHAPA
jgi:hypothetical protein